MGASWHVFLSHAKADGEWVRVLAENLHQLDVDVFFDEWTIAPGDVVVHELDEGLRDSLAGALVVSPVALERPWVKAEYAAMMTRAVQEGFRLIPVLLKDAELPPLLASLSWVDFRTVDGPEYFTKVKELAALLKGERKGPPPRTGVLKPPPGTGFRPEGSIRRGLTISRERATLQGDGVLVQERVRGADHGLESLVWELGRARWRCWGASRDAGGAAEGLAELETILASLGHDLAEAFLPLPVAGQLAADVAEAERLGCPLELAVQVEDALARLPWETLRLPAYALPLTLHPRVHLYRRLPSKGAATAIAIPPPLRILVAIGSPEAQNPRGELLDMEVELRRILDATEKAKGKAHVRILETGSPEAIGEALRLQRYHVLYISCHAEPGKLVLETADGAEVRVSAAELIGAIPAGRAAPLMVLAACSTASDRPGNAEAKAEELPGIAHALVAHGMPQVIAMQGPVGDAYATLLAGELLEALAGWEQPEVLAALASARRDLEQARQREPGHRRPPPEWATPALYTSAEPLPLFDPKAKPETIESRPQPRLDPGVAVRRVGEMVGRRRELRLARRTLGDPARSGVVVHGMGGVGKSTLAAELMHRLGADGFVLASLAGSIEVDPLLSEVGQRLLAYARAKELNERHPLREVAKLLREPKEPWRDRLDALMSEVLGEVPLALLLDNFEDNLTDGTIGDEALAQLLALWAASPGRSRLILTCRYPFVLPDEAQLSLEFVHLGPLSFAETRKLILRLPGLNALPASEQRRVYEDVGGHPRALEYLDALLRGGRARFPDVQKRLNAALAKQGVTDPSRWCADTAGGLDAALAETVTLASADVLLADLLARLADQPLAKRLLLGASVYRLPVNETGLAWTVATPVERPADPERQARIERVHRAWREAQVRGERPDLSPTEVGQYERDMQEELRPPIAVPETFPDACRLLADLTLLSPVRYAEDEPERFLVHRWTAGEVQDRADEEERQEAHRAAAANWRWRHEKLPQSREQDIEDLLEARFHHHAAGERDQAVEVTEWVCARLHTWGAWERKQGLLAETLTWLPLRSAKAAAFQLQLGIVAELRGDYDATLGWTRKALEIFEHLRDGDGVARSYHQLGNVAQARGDYDAALHWYRKALAIFEKLGDRACTAGCYHELGLVAQDRGDRDAALDWHSRSLAIFEELGDHSGVASCYHRLGMVAEIGGDYDAALGWYRKALEIFKQLPAPAGMASSYHQLGMVAHRRGDHDAALGWYRKALEINEQLDDGAGMARSYHQLGMLAHDRGDYGPALDWYRKALAIREQLGVRRGMAGTLGQIGRLHTETGDPAKGFSFNLQSLALHSEIGLPDIGINLYWLARQRELLGQERFHQLLIEHLGNEGAATVEQLLEQQPPQSAADR